MSLSEGATITSRVPCRRHTQVLARSSGWWLAHCHPIWRFCGPSSHTGTVFTPSSSFIHTLHVHSGPGPVLRAGDAAVNKTNQSPHSVSLHSGGSGEPTGTISVNEWEVLRNAGKQGRGMGATFPRVTRHLKRQLCTCLGDATQAEGTAAREEGTADAKPAGKSVLHTSGSMNHGGGTLEGTGLGELQSSCLTPNRRGPSAMPGEAMPGEVATRQLEL